MSLFKISNIKYYYRQYSMKIQLPEIVWHGRRQRILSIDFHCITNQFVTGGSYQQDLESSEVDGYAKIWQINEYAKTTQFVTFKYGLQKHTNNVNTVKFSPDGEYLATGSDDKSIIIWQKKQDFVNFYESRKQKVWGSKSVLLGHIDEVIDLKWSNNSKYIVSGGIDKRIYIWHVQKTQYIKILSDHARFVQGIAMDPKFKYIISGSNDRSFKIWKNAKTKKQDVCFYCFKTIKKSNFITQKKKEMVQEQKSDINASSFKMFFDENTATFFRRPDVSPDGQLFLMPAGQWQKKPEDNIQHCAFLYRRKFLERPSFYITTKGQPSICVRFCQKLFKKPEGSRGMFQQPYYMVFAIGTINTVLIYNTLTLAPIYAYGNYHYASITQLCWRNSSILAVSSSDGFCSFVIFNKNELGQQYEITDQKLIKIMKKEKKQQTQKPQKKEQPKIQMQTTIVTNIQTGQSKKKIIPRLIQKFVS